MYRFFIVLLSTVVFVFFANAQNPLPAFSVQNLGDGRVVVSWVNPYSEGCVQIAVQKSYDSLRNFRTFFSTPSPQLPENGVVDNPVPGIKVFYRIFYVLLGGTYYFTQSKNPGAGFDNDSVVKQSEAPQMFTIFLNGDVLAQYDFINYLKFRDSIVSNTKDDLVMLSATQIILKRHIDNGIWMPSKYVFTNSEGLVDVKLPDAQQNKYKLTIFDADGKKLLEINQVTEPELILDKANFIHAGWFNFELYENEKFKERNKFYLQREF